MGRGAQGAHTYASKVRWARGTTVTGDLLTLPVQVVGSRAAARRAPGGLFTSPKISPMARNPANGFPGKAAEKAPASKLGSMSRYQEEERPAHENSSAPPAANSASAQRRRRDQPLNYTFSFTETRTYINLLK